MDLIDRDELELDTEWSEYYDGFTSYSQSQINGAVEVQAIPLDKVKQAREKISQRCYGNCDLCSYCNNLMGVREVFSIIDKLIAESEE